ncbi:coagulation factor XI [Culex quinquefasciatus]|uniref:Coagulation factor XI n=1 Tax=Culex quinquefasciatus TaxID=7176 RepID=B0WA93_CULQU|nr:coagulation factor XI [Culex quinquefasciatus]|eukprot:XP_001845627.1 coagulation factor XI [Culex quinquefasciatus]
MVCSHFVTVLLIAITGSIVGSPTGSDTVVHCHIPNETDDGTCVDLKKCPAFQEINHVEMMANTSRVCCPQGIDSYRKPWISVDVESRVRFGIRTRTSVSHEDDNECGLGTFRDRILRGNIAQIDEFPWAALLKFNKKFPGCGAVLISRNFVLTAAHCLIGEEYNTYGPLELVRLREYNLLVDPDCEVQEELLDFQARNGNALSPIKMKASCRLWSKASAKKISLICAGGRRQDSCNGDSGSPLMFYDWKNGVWVLSGIVSIGRKDCGTVGSPGIYSSVVEYLPWIKVCIRQKRNEASNSLGNE